MLKRLTKRERRVLKQTSNSTTNGGFSTSLKEFSPLTESQKEVFRNFDNDEHLVLHGLAGTGKSFISLYLALRQVLTGSSDFNKIVIVRSVVPTREVGFLPGSVKEKIKVYEQPYETICTELFDRGDAYSVLKGKNYVEFMSTSFIRGITLDNCIVIVDEVQNMLFGELDSVITRIGKNSKLVLCGDFRQTDLQKDVDRRGLLDILKILKSMDYFKYVEFGEQDIVRSDFVKQYIIQKSRLGFT
jgi:phosphate starvation-inducible PhoH-like protein